MAAASARAPRPRRARPAAGAARAAAATGAEALVASGRRFDLRDAADKAAMKAMLKKRDWQTEAWNYYDLVPEVAFGVNYIGHMLSRLRIFPAYVPDLDAEPVAIDGDDDDPDLPAGLAEAAIEEVGRMAAGTGDHGGLLGPLAQQLSVPGEGWVIAADFGDGEEWHSYSVDEIKVDDRDVRLLAGPEDQEGEPLPDDAFTLRIWQPHPRWRAQATSPMRALLDPCEELLLLNQAIRGAARSRLNAGILAIPDELSVIQRQTEGGPPKPENQKLLVALADAMSIPIAEPDDATSVIPLLLKGPKDALEALRHILINRPFDTEQLAQRNELRGVLATGLDLPREIILGLADANHWTGWLVDEQTYKAHLDPLALLMLDALTRKVLHPALAERGFDPTRIIIWRDPEDLIADQESWARDNEAYDRFTISDAAYRRRRGYSEEEAPTPEEIAERVARKATIRVTEPNGAAPPASEVGTEAPPAEPSRGEEGAPPAEAEARAEALVAALQPRGSLPLLANRLWMIDVRLRQRIQDAADAAVRRALEIAGNRARTRLSREKLIPDLALRARRLDYVEAVKGIPAGEVCPILGQKNVRALGLEDEDLIDGELGDLPADETDPKKGTLAAAFLAATTGAYGETRRVVNRHLVGTMTDGDERTADETARRAIDAGWALLAAAIATTIRDRLFALPNEPQAPARGEFDANVVVPPGLVREALAVAGGASTAAPDASSGGPSGAIATGDATASMLSQFYGTTVDGGRWVYGDPGSRTTPFEAHADLDGVDFASWDDDVLANPDTWPPVPYYFPGDHDWCQCDYIPALELAEDQNVGDAESDVA